MNNKYYGYIYLTILSFNSIEKFPNCNPFYIGQRKRKFNSRYYGSDRIINDWFESKIGQIARNARSKLCEQLGIKRYVLVYAKFKQELDKLEKFFVDPSLNTYGCININEGGNSPSNEFIENLVVRNKSLEFRNKVSKGQVEGRKNPIRKKKLSEWHNEYWSNPPHHEKHSLAGKNLIMIPKKPKIIYPRETNDGGKTTPKHVFGIIRRQEKLFYKKYVLQSVFTE
jgi:hypothetical protein